MSLASEIAKRKGGKKKESKPSLVLDDSLAVKVGGTEERELTIKEAAERFAEVDAQVKEYEAVKGSFAEALKEAGVAALREAERQGRYYAAALAGTVQVSRQNKYRPVTVAGRDELVEALGVVEYGTLFSEKACLEFESVDQMRGFIDSCMALGVKVPGKVVETVTPRSTFAERKCQIAGVLPADKVELVEKLGEATTFAISVKREEVSCE